MSTPHFRKLLVSPLGQFFGGYLGQDWALEFPNPWSAVEAYVAAEPADIRQSARHELSALLALPLDDTELGRRADRLGLNYRASVEGTTNRQWLEKVERYLRDHES